MCSWPSPPASLRRRGAASYIRGQYMQDAQDAQTTHATNVMDLPVANIIIGDNYRKKLGDLGELKASIKRRGVRHPITVRPLKDGTGYEVVTGQRRLCATAELGLPTIPAI